MQIKSNTQYKTRGGEVVTAESYDKHATWFPWRIKRSNGVYYTATVDGKKMWNANHDLDLIEEVK